MRIAIVNDMQIAVVGLKRIIQGSSDHTVAWTADDGEEAVKRCMIDTPDLILMDIIMPIMNGVEATRHIMAESPCPILIVTSSVDGNAAMVFEAMGCGALDVVKTPVIGLNGEIEGNATLMSKIATIQKLSQGAKSNVTSISTRDESPSSKSQGNLVAIGSSTGGPAVLAMILSCLPENYSAGVVIVQHVDAHFANELAKWLDNQCVLPVRIARKGESIQNGTVLIAATGDHLVLSKEQQLVYTSEPSKLVYRPSVDVFFNSLANHWPGKVVAALLTGMGGDGAAGLLNLRQHGAYTIAQDKETCAVYGMPKVAKTMNAAKIILPDRKIGPAVVERFPVNDNQGKLEAQ